MLTASGERWTCSFEKAADEIGETIPNGDAMLAHEQVDELICLLATWDRQTLTAEFMAFESGFPVDVTPEFLSGLSDDRLRHLFLALCIQNKRLPAGAVMQLAA